MRDLYIMRESEAREYARRGDVILVDVRTPEEYEEYHWEEAVNIPFDELEPWLRKLTEVKKIIFCCEFGNQSLLATRIARKKGWEAYSVSGGIGTKKLK